MQENQNVVVENVEETTSQASSPQAKEPVEVQQTPQGNESGETKAQDVEVDSAVSELPEETDAQRKAFQEMRLENKRLKEEAEARRKSESAFAVFKNQGNQQGPVTIDQFADPTTGEVDWNKYNLAVQNQASAIANQQVQERLDEYEARKDYPELFADPETEKEIASMWLFEKYQGNNASIKEVASRYATRHSKTIAKAVKQGAETALTELSVKEKASLEARGQNASQAQSQQSREDSDALKERVRRGDDDALTSLMSKVPWGN